MDIELARGLNTALEMMFNECSRLLRLSKQFNRRAAAQKLIHDELHEGLEYTDVKTIDKTKITKG